MNRCVAVCDIADGMGAAASAAVSTAKRWEWSSKLPEFRNNFYTHSTASGEGGVLAVCGGTVAHDDDESRQGGEFLNL